MYDLAYLLLIFHWIMELYTCLPCPSNRGTYTDVRLEIFSFDEAVYASQILECTVSLVHWTCKINLGFVSLGEAQGKGPGEGCKVWEGPSEKSFGSCSFAWMVLFRGSWLCSKGCVPVTISVQTAFLRLQVLHTDLPNHCLAHWFSHLSSF